MSARWTEQVCQIAETTFRDLAKNAGFTKRQIFAAIARKIGHSEGAVVHRYYTFGETFRGKYLRGKDQNKCQAEAASGVHAEPWFHIPQRVLDDRACRRALDPSSITAALCGDPLPGYSALDRRSA